MRLTRNDQVGQRDVELDDATCLLRVLHVQFVQLLLEVLLAGALLGEKNQVRRSLIAFWLTSGINHLLQTLEGACADRLNLEVVAQSWLSRGSVVAQSWLSRASFLCIIEKE
jgi:hypothetical protein